MKRQTDRHAQTKVLNFLNVDLKGHLEGGRATRGGKDGMTEMTGESHPEINVWSWQLW